MNLDAWDTPLYFSRHLNVFVRVRSVYCLDNSLRRLHVDVDINIYVSAGRSLELLDQISATQMLFDKITLTDAWLSARLSAAAGRPLTSESLLSPIGTSGSVIGFPDSLLTQSRALSL